MDLPVARLSKQLMDDISRVLIAELLGSTEAG
jgi:hypothetical protein